MRGSLMSGEEQEEVNWGEQNAPGICPLPSDPGGLAVWENLKLQHAHLWLIQALLLLILSTISIPHSDLSLLHRFHKVWAYLGVLQNWKFIFHTAAKMGDLHELVITLIGSWPWPFNSLMSNREIFLSRWSERVQLETEYKGLEPVWQ